MIAAVAAALAATQAAARRTPLATVNEESHLPSLLSRLPDFLLSCFAALELRDGVKGDYMGKGVSKAVANVNTVIGPALVGMSPADQKAIDDKMVQELDGSKNDWGWSKSKLGANAILGVSMAVCKAGAASKDMPLYKHIAELAGNATDKMTMPVRAWSRRACGRQRYACRRCSRAAGCHSSTAGSYRRPAAAAAAHDPSPLADSSSLCASCRLLPYTNRCRRSTSSMVAATLATSSRCRSS